MTKSQVQEAKIANPSPAMMRACDTLHNLFCKANHSELDACAYYLEEQVDFSWTTKNHKMWLSVIDNLVEIMDMSYEDFEGLLRSAIDRVAKLRGQLSIQASAMTYIIMSKDENIVSLSRILGQAIEDATIRVEASPTSQSVVSPSQKGNPYEAYFARALEQQHQEKELAPDQPSSSTREQEDDLGT